VSTAIAHSHSPTFRLGTSVCAQHVLLQIRLPEGLLHHPLFLQNVFSIGHQAILICVQACTIVMADVTIMLKDWISTVAHACAGRSITLHSSFAWPCAPCLGCLQARGLLSRGVTSSRRTAGRSCNSYRTMSHTWKQPSRVIRVTVHAEDDLCDSAC